MFKLAVAATLACATAHTRTTFDAKEFLQGDRAPGSAMMSFTVALPVNNWEILDAKLADISNPSSPNYANWMTSEEVRALIAPPAALRTEVAHYLASHRATCVDGPSSLRCMAPVASVETMFSTKIHTFTQVPSGKIIYRAHPSSPFSMPASLAGKMLFATSIVDFPTRRMRMGSGVHAVGAQLRGGAVKAGVAKASIVGATDYIVTLETLNAMYGTAPGNMASTQGPAEFQNDDAITSADIQTWATQMNIPVWNISQKHGPFGGSDTEATLDGQYIAGVGLGNDQWWWTEADWMYEWTQALVAQPTGGLAAVYSVSWGWSEQDQCEVDPTGPCQGSGTSATYVATTNQGFAAVAALGVSILISSGDSGAHGRTDGACQSKKTLPDWPAASPYVLAIGATQLQNGGTPLANPMTPYCKNPTDGPCAGGGVEVTCSTATGALIVSGGGFSVYSPAMSYQTAAVAAYLTSGALLPPAGDFNASNRAYPDVSALGHNVWIYESGGIPVDGTSCSAPIFGGVIGLANAARLAAGKKVLGFVNQAIYTVAASTPGAFFDVTLGDNSCTEDGCVTGCTGFGAVKGYDAATGLGTPVIPKLVAALAAL